ncbi:MAG: hypothetical protein ACP6IT_11415 [Candidatus Thorarchaeota archaeon]
MLGLDERTMVELFFGDLTLYDALMGVLTGVAGGAVLGTAYLMSRRGIAHWKARKLVHVTMGTVIAVTIVNYSNLSGPTFAIGVFLTVLFYAWAHKSSLISELLVAGSRENETRLNTFVSGFMGMVGFAVAFLVFFSEPGIFVAAILAVAWADAAGEIIGRTYGGRLFGIRIRNKTLEGSMGVLVFSAISLVFALVSFSTVDPVTVLPQTIAIAAMVTVTEAVSTRWLDNFLIPIVTSFAMWLLVFPMMPLFPPP